MSPLPRTVPFTLVERQTLGPPAYFVFGFVNAMVDSSGVPVLVSPGVVDFNQPADSGEGLDGTGTSNVWAVTNSYVPSPVVALGTTFGPAAANPDYSFFGSYRTYSADASGVTIETDK